MVNFLCFCGEGTISVDKHIVETPRVVPMTPTTQTVSRANPIQLKINAHLPRCDDLDTIEGSLVFLWKVHETTCKGQPLSAACGPSQVIP